MSDNLKAAKQRLVQENLTCVLCKDNVFYTSILKGVAPMVCFIKEKTDLQGFSVADKIVGKAAAYLFVLAGVAEVYATVISQGAISVLEHYHIAYEYDKLTESIINRAGTGICPMEEAVSGVMDPTEALTAILDKQKKLQQGEHV